MDHFALPKIDTRRCTLCGACIEACDVSALSKGTDGPFFSSPEKCSYCTDCEALCPEGAIRCELEISWSND